MNSLHILRKISLCFALFVCACATTGGTTWIDVRTPDEFSEKHVPEALNIPYDQIGSEIAALQLKKDQQIYLYCGSGRRAGLAKETLDKLGYTRVVNIGGLDDALAEAEKTAPE
jgi:phage shock protein E